MPWHKSKNEHCLLLASSVFFLLQGKIYINYKKIESQSFLFCSLQPLGLAHKWICVLSQANETRGDILLRFLQRKCLLLKVLSHALGVVGGGLRQTSFFYSEGHTGPQKKTKSSEPQRNDLRPGWILWCVPSSPSSPPPCLEDESPTGRSWVLLTGASEVSLAQCLA